MFGLRKKYNKIEENTLPEVFRKSEDQRIIAEIYNRYSHLMLGIALKYLKNKTDAEDLVMDIMEKLPKLLMSHKINYFKSWLYTVTKNECLMKLRKNNYDVDIESIAIKDSSNADYDEKIADEQKIEILEKVLADLEPMQKTVIQAFYLDDMSYIEISEKFGYELKKVKSAIQNGKRNLKIKLQNHEVFKTME